MERLQKSLPVCSHTRSFEEKARRWSQDPLQKRSPFKEVLAPEVSSCVSAEKSGTRGHMAKVDLLLVGAFHACGRCRCSNSCQQTWEFVARSNFSPGADRPLFTGQVRGGVGPSSKTRLVPTT